MTNPQISNLATEAISVVIVSDADAGNRDWHDELQIVDAFTRQVGVDIEEILLVENASYEAEFPASLFSMFPAFRTVFAAERSGSALKDIGVREARGHLIAMFEADSIPAPDCLSQLRSTLLANPGAAACSARSIYTNYDRSMLRRCLTFLGRGQLAALGYRRQISNNAALLHAAVAKSFPYPDRVSPFVAASERNAALRKAGHRFAYNHDAIVLHKFEGLSFEAAYRRQKGFQKMEGQSQKLPRRIPRMLLYTALSMWQSVFTADSDQLRRSDAPAALLLGCILPLLEIPGMVDSLKGRSNAGSHFR